MALTRRGPGAVRLRTAIVGAGLMGRWHARAAARAGAQITAVVDSNGQAAEQLAASYPGSQPLSGLEAALAAVDVVHICTPTATHLPYARLALDAGRHALIEKPLAPTAADTEALIALARERGVLICPVYQFLFQDGVQHAIRRHARAGTLRRVEAIICSAGAEGSDDEARDRIAFDILPHHLALLARLAPAALARADWSVRHPAPGEIAVLASGPEFTVSLLVSMSGRPTANRLILTGAHDTTHVDLFHGFAAIEHGAVSRVRKMTQPFTYAAAIASAATANLARRAWRQEPAYPGLRSLVAGFYRAAGGDGEPPIPPAESLAVARAWDQIRSLL